MGQTSSVSVDWAPSASSSVVGYKVHYGTQSGNYTGCVAVGNVTNATIAGLSAGTTYYFVVTATHTLGFDSLYSNELTFSVPAPAVALADAVDAPTLTWTTGGNTVWIGETAVKYDGADAAQSGALGNSQTNWIETVVTGPGTLTFWWKVSSETNYDFVRFFVNGVLQTQRSGEGDWAQVSYALPVGQQTLRWDYRKDPNVVGGQDAAWVDQVSFAPGTTLTVASANPASGVSITASPNDLNGLSSGQTGLTRTYPSNTVATLTAAATAGGNTFQKWQRDGVDWASTLSTTVTMDRNHTLTAVYQAPVALLTLADALDTPGWTWTTGGNTVWNGETSVTHDAADAAQSGSLGNNQTNWIETVVTGPGTLTFWWKVSSETNYDFVRFFVNGVLQTQRSGEGDWAQVSYALPVGQQTLRWDYRKDPNVVGGQDAAWVDQVSFAPGTTLTVASANPTSGVSITASPGDLNGLASGQTGFTRTYPSNTVATLTTAATAGGNTFQKWQRDGVDWASTLSTTVTMDRNHTLTAVYQAPVSVLTLADALDTPGWTWTTGGNTVWNGETSVTHDAADAAQSGSLGNNQTNWIETVVTGPGTLTFWWKVSSETNYDFSRFFVNGVLQAQRSGEGDWAQASYTLPAGPQTLRWDYRKDPNVVGGQDAAWVDQISFVPTPTATATLADALDTPGWSWTTAGTSAWSPKTAVAHDGVDSAQSGTLGNSQTNWIETVVTGPGTLTFWWKVSSETNYDFVRFFVNGVLQTQRSGEGDWAQASYALPAGQQTLRWDYRKDQSVAAGQDAAWVDQVCFVPGSALTLADALDTPGWTWTTGGNTPAWSAQTALTHDGVDGVRSGALGNNQTNWIETVVTGPGTLTFWWKVSSEANYDFARFFVNGVLQTQRSGEGDWAQASYTLGSGQQTLRWDYRKDPNVVAGQDAAWVDQVSFVSGASAPIVTASLPASAVPSTPLIVSIRAIENGRASLHLTGSAAQECRILASDSLVEWTEIGRVTIAADGAAEFVDPIPVPPDRRFYRAVEMSPAP